MRQAEEKYRRLFEEDLSANVIATPNGTIVACNPSFAAVFGFGCWWTLLGMAAARWTSTVRAVFRPFADRFNQRHAKQLTVTGVVAAVIGIATLTLPQFFAAMSADPANNAVLLSVIIVVANLIVDILYGFLDPRVRVS